MKLLSVLAILMSTNVLADGPSRKCLSKAKRSYKRYTERIGYQYVGFKYVSRLGEYLENINEESSVDIEIVKKEFSKHSDDSFVFIGESDYMGGSGGEAIVYDAKRCRLKNYRTVWSD